MPNFLVSATPAYQPASLSGYLTFCLLIYILNEISAIQEMIAFANKLNESQPGVFKYKSVTILRAYILKTVIFN